MIAIPREDVLRLSGTKQMLLATGDNQDLFAPSDLTSFWGSSRLSGGTTEKALGYSQVNVKGRGNDYYYMTVIIPFNPNTVLNAGDASHKQNVGVKF